MMHGIIVFENIRFCPSARKRRSQRFHSGEPFRKDAFPVTVSAEHMSTVGQTAEKNLRFQTKTDTCGRGYGEFHKEGFA